MVLLLIGVFGRSPSTVVSGGEPIPIASTPTHSAPLATTAVPGTTAPTTTTGPPGSAPQSTTSPVDLPDLDVVVLNSTSETGLASRVSTYLSGLGWSIGKPGNAAAPLEATTVYFPAGYEDVARALATVSPGSGTTVAPVTPEVGAGVLTVVLGADAVGWTPPTPGTPT